MAFHMMQVAEVIRQRRIQDSIDFVSLTGPPAIDTMPVYVCPACRVYSDNRLLKNRVYYVQQEDTYFGCAYSFCPHCNVLLGDLQGQGLRVMELGNPGTRWIIEQFRSTSPPAPNAQRISGEFGWIRRFQDYLIFMLIKDRDPACVRNTIQCLVRELADEEGVLMAMERKQFFSQNIVNLARADMQAHWPWYDGTRWHDEIAALLQQLRAYALNKKVAAAYGITMRE